MAGNASSTNIQISLLDSSGNPTLIANTTNTVKLRLVNQTGAGIPLTASTPSPTPADGQFQIQLFLDALFTDAAAAGSVQISAHGWSVKYFDDADFPCWSVAPTSATTWMPNDFIQLTISNLRPTVQLGSYYLTVNLWSLPGADSPFPYNTTVGVQSPTPTGAKKLKLVMKATLGNSSIYITKNPSEPEKSDLVLTLVNEDPTTPLVPDDLPWGSEPPKFILSFIYSRAPGNFALSSQEAANSIEVGLEDGIGWKPPQKVDGPRWILEPTQNNHNVLGVQDNSIVTFSIKNIVTQLTPGPTLAYLQCLNVPGYGDTFYAILINKQFKPLSMGNLSINKTSYVVDGAVPAKAYLSWTVSGATLVELSGVGQVPSSQMSYEVSVDRTMPFVLTAYDMFNGSLQTASVIARVTPDYTTRWLPTGTVMAWNGSSNAVPAGYALCDGSHGTPDLRDRFVLGAGNGTQPLTVFDDHHVHSLPGLAAQTFTTSTESSSHTHGMPTNWYSRNLSCGKWASADSNGAYNSNTQSGTNSTTHTHTVFVNFNSPMTGTAHGRTRPAWYALSYIMLLPATAS